MNRPTLDPGGEQAFVRVMPVPLLGGVRGGFTVPMHAQKRMEAFPERASAPGGPHLELNGVQNLSQL